MLVKNGTSTICVLVRFIRIVIHPLRVELMMERIYYLIILVGKNYIRERKNIIGISNIWSLFFHLPVKLSLIYSVTFFY